MVRVDALLSMKLLVNTLSRSCCADPEAGLPQTPNLCRHSRPWLHHYTMYSCVSGTRNNFAIDMPVWQNQSHCLHVQPGRLHGWSLHSHISQTKAKVDEAIQWPRPHNHCPSKSACIQHPRVCGSSTDTYISDTSVTTTNQVTNNRQGTKKEPLGDKVLREKKRSGVP